MSIDPTSTRGVPRSIPGSTRPVRQTRPPSAISRAPSSAVALSKEARQGVSTSAQSIKVRLFGETAIPKSLALPRAAQDMSVNTYKFLQQMYPKLDAEQALMQGMRDLCPTSHQHCERVGELALRLAREMDLDGDEADALEQDIEDCSDFKEAGILALSISAMDDQELEEFLEDAAFSGEMHDIGKMAIPAEILDKPGPLTDEEFEIVKLHPMVGETMLTPLDLPDEVLASVRGHHEHWDGSGYPDGLKGGEIPMTARILTIVDSFDAMTAGRPYRDTLSPQEALEEILSKAGTQFDPFLAEMFAQMMARRDSSIKL